VVDISRVLILDYRTYQTDIYKVPTIWDSVNTKSFLPHNKNIVTFKDLQKVIESQPDYNNPEQSQPERLRDKAFWHWDRGEHKEKDRTYKDDCCFNHIVGLPRKDGKRKPLFDYDSKKGAVWVSLTCESEL
jgi:hypothetical protein